MIIDPIQTINYLKCMISSLKDVNKNISHIKSFVQLPSRILITFYRSISQCTLALQFVLYYSMSDMKLKVLFFLSGFSVTYIHDSQDSRTTYLTPLYHFHPLCRHLDIGRAITEQNSRKPLNTKSRFLNSFFIEHGITALIILKGEKQLQTVAIKKVIDGY